MRELREASVIKADDPKLYYSLAGRGEIRRDVQRFLQVVDTAKRHRMSIKDALGLDPFTLQCLTMIKPNPRA